MANFILQAFVVAVFISLVLFFISIMGLLFGVIVIIILVAYIVNLAREIIAKR